MARIKAAVDRGILFLAGALALAAGCTTPRAAGQAGNPTAMTSPPSWNPTTPPPATAGPYGAAPRVDPNVVPASATSELPPGADPTARRAGSSQPIMAGPVRAKDKSDDEDSGWDISHLAPDYTWKQFKVMIGWGPDERIARQEFQQGQALFQQKKYDEAADHLYTASWRWPDSPLEEDALFLMGESYFFADHYGKAQDAYANLLKQHDNTRHLDAVMAREFAIARYWEKLDDESHHWPTTPNVTDKTQPWFDTLGNALASYEVIRLHDPTGPLADLSIMATANIYFRRGEFEEAAYHYDLIRRDYPKSRFQKEAHLLALQSHLHTYQGAKYDPKPLTQAKQIADQTLTQFPGQLGAEEARVREAEARIYEQKAEREWMIAQYYDGKKEYGAARRYYKYTLDTYPRTQSAEKARVRMQEIEGLPDSPPNYFGWLSRALHEK